MPRDAPPEVIARRFVRLLEATLARGTRRVIRLLDREINPNAEYPFPLDVIAKGAHDIVNAAARIVTREPYTAALRAGLLRPAELRREFAAMSTERSPGRGPR